MATDQSRWRAKSWSAGLMLLSVVMAGCSAPPAALGDCVQDEASDAVLGHFPGKVDCPSGDRDVRERLFEPIHRIVAVGSSVDEVDSNPACGDGLNYVIWYDDDFAMCGELVR